MDNEMELICLNYRICVKYYGEVSIVIISQ